MEKQLWFALSVLAFGNDVFARPSEEPSVKINIAPVNIGPNTDQDSTHKSFTLVEEDGKWKTLKDRNGGARQMSISSRLPGVAKSGRFQ